jgi:hypothetical protein
MWKRRPSRTVTKSPESKTTNKLRKSFWSTELKKSKISKTKS